MDPDPRYRSDRAIERAYQESGPHMGVDCGSLASALEGLEGYVEDFLKEEAGSRLLRTFTRHEGRP